MSLIYPEHIRKYVGVIKQNLDKAYYSFTYQNKELNIIIKKKFPYFDESSRLLAYDSALKYKFDYSIQNNLVLNLYSIEVDPSGNTYYKVNLNVPNQFLFVNIKDKSLIENFDWRIQNNSTYATTYMNDEDYQKFYSYLTSIKNNSNDPNITYVYENMLQKLEEKENTQSNDINTKKRHYIPFHLMKYGLEHVDFLNKNRLDNRDENIGLLSKSQHSWKSQVGDAKLRVNNSSGKAGVFYGKCGNYDYWEVRGKDFLGNKIYRKFSINKHGYEGSKHMAFHFRDLVIDKSYKPHQLEEIYKKVVHEFENYHSKYNIDTQSNQIDVSLLDNEEDDNITVITKVDNHIKNMVGDNDEDDDFIIINPK
jgi:hypothetical protein